MFIFDKMDNLELLLLKIYFLLDGKMIFAYNLRTYGRIFEIQTAYAQYW